MTVSPSKTEALTISTQDHAAGSTAPGRNVRFNARSFLEKYALLGLLLLIFVTCFALLPAFRSGSVIGATLNSQALILMLALTATVVLRTGDFDLSIAGVMVTSGAVIGVMTAAGFPWYLAVLVALIMGAAVGAVNAYLVVKIGTDSFITTIGMFTAMTGLGYAITDSRIITDIPAVLTEFARFKMLGIPITTWVGWLLVIVVWYAYEKTPLGRFMLFIGGNRDASTLAGINVNRIRIGSFITSGVLSAGIGVFLVGNLGAIDPSIGAQYLLTPFAAVFLGATAITVGRFNSFGTLIALYLLAIGFTGLQIMGAPSWINNVFNGVALMAAVALAKIAGKKNAKTS